MVWQKKQDTNFKIEYPEKGFSLLDQHYQKYNKENGHNSDLLLPAKTNVVLIILESFAMQPLREKPEIAPFLSKLREQSDVVSLENHFTVVKRTVGAHFSLWSSKFDPPAFYVMRLSTVEFVVFLKYLMRRVIRLFLLVERMESLMV